MCWIRSAVMSQPYSESNGPEDQPLHHPPHQDHEKCQGQGVQEVTKLCKLFWIYDGVVDRLWLLHCVPGDARGEPDVFIPEPGGLGGLHDREGSFS